MRLYELYDADDTLAYTETSFQDLLSIPFDYGSAMYVIWRIIFTTGLTGSSNKNGSGTAHSFILATASGPSTYVFDPYSSNDEACADFAWGNQANVVYDEAGHLKLQVRWTGTGTDPVRFIARAEVMRNPS